MWEIYSIGDSAYLAAILNAVAMITGTGDFRQLAGVGFLLGVLLVLFQGILEGGRGIRFQNILVAWLLYALMFGPTARVAIEDAYSGAVRVVDNVPLGPAAVGSLLSNVGYGVARLFEQAFATPAMTDTGFADPLQTLMSVRKGTLSRIALGAANSPTPGADIERSFINYVADCTLYDVDIGQRSIDDVLRDPSWDTALRSDLNVPTTELLLGGAPQLLPCDAAWTAALGVHRRRVRPGPGEQPPGPDAPRRPGGRHQQGPVCAGCHRRCRGGCPELHGHGGHGRVPREGHRADPRGHRPVGARRHHRAGRPAAQRPVGGGADALHPHRAPHDDLLRGADLRHHPVDGLHHRARSRGDRHDRQVPAVRAVDPALDADHGHHQPLSAHGHRRGPGRAAAHGQPHAALHPRPLQAGLPAPGLSGHRRAAGGEHPGDQPDADLRQRHHRHPSGRTAAGRRLRRREDHLARTCCARPRRSP